MPEPQNATVSCKQIGIADTMAVTIKDLAEALDTLNNINSELAERLMPVIRPFSKDEGVPVDASRDIRSCSPLVDQLRNLESRLRVQIRGVRMIIDNMEI